MDELVILKFGGGLITDKSLLCTSKPSVIRNLAETVSKLDSLGYRIIVVHGAGSYGHLKAKRWKLHEGLIEGYKPEHDEGITDQHAAVESVRNDMLILNQEVIDALESFGLTTECHPPHKWASDTGAEFSGDLSLLNYSDGTIAVTFGDVVHCNDDKRFGILSGDDICYRLALENDATHMIFAMGGAAGLLTAPPSHSDAELIPVWSPDSEYEGEHLSSMDVTGGINLKIERASIIAKYVPNVWIVDGEHPSRIEEAITLHKTVGTKILFKSP
ncbi:MAG: isopentenyl phosphate kinase [Candidatus Thalassarchaeaceae archaeon]|nr:isopentenyl phosphate kinase [Candidatus Thalassarchaeaceae archaeon]MDP7042596.1 isopentenyl phosphate kinase [Candidatus Thalassarchaeaceae archaeon]